MSRKRKRHIVVFVALAAILLFVASKIEIQSVEEHYDTGKEAKGKTITATIAISCDTILANYDKLEPALQQEQYVPKDGVILKETTYEMEEGDSVFDLLNQAVKEQRIQMEYQGADETAYGSVYIQGINHLYEFSCGPLSGWMYRVNDKIPDYGCSKYALTDGDLVEFVYTCDLGKDLGRD